MALSLIAAAISGGVALTIGLLTVLVTLANNKRTWANTKRQLDLEYERLEDISKHAKEEINTRLEELRQTQVTELVKKRLESYPHLYGVIADYGRNWEIRGRPWDNAWASEFLNALIDCNARFGVYFSDDVYVAYGHLRELLEAIRRSTLHGGLASAQQIEEMYAIVRNKYDGRGLGSFMKDDVGGFLLGASSRRLEVEGIRGHGSMRGAVDLISASH